MANDNTPGTTPDAAQNGRRHPERDAELSPAELRKKVWGETREGEDLALREAKLGADGEIDDTTDLVEAESPGVAQRISDPYIKSPKN